MGIKIGVFSIRKGVGLTTTSLNICGMLSKIMANKQTLYIDTNTIYRDIESYLTDSTIVPGIEEFIMHYKTGSLTNKKFVTHCTKETDYNISLMSGATDSIIDNQLIESLFPYVDENFDYVVLENNSFSTEKAIMDHTDIQICVLSPNKKSISELATWKNNRTDKKFIYVFSNYIEKYKHEKNALTKNRIYTLIEEIGIERKDVYILPFDLNIVNEANNQSILNFINSRHNRNTDYVKEMIKLTKRIAGDE